MILGSIILWLMFGGLMSLVTGTKLPGNPIYCIGALIAWPIYVGCNELGCCDCNV